MRLDYPHHWTGEACKVPDQGGGIMAEVNLDQLKLKYQSVLNLMDTLGVQLQNLHVQDNKLVIRGQAKTKDDVNKVWNQIKLVEKNYKLDLMVDLTFLSDAPAPKPQTAPTLRIHKVVAGETLSMIARKYYGNASEYMKIFNANKDKLKDPDKIFPGQDLIIP
jgi:LysM repeat protein